VIDIAYDSRLDYSREKRVKSVSISNTSGSLIQKFTFNHEYLGQAGGERKLILKEIIPSGTTGAELPGWVFSYKDEGISLPPRLTFMTDYWGYYNGDTNNDTPGTIALGAYTYPTSITEGTDMVGYAPGINMEPDPIYSRIGLLESIKYPTRGTETYAYEANRYSYISNSTSQLYDLQQVIGEKYEASFNSDNSYAPVVDSKIITLNFEFSTVIYATSSGFTENGVDPTECEIPTFITSGGGGDDGTDVLQYLGIAYLIPYGNEESENRPFLVGPEGSSCGTGIGGIPNGDYQVKFTLFQEIVDQGGYGIVHMEVETEDYWKRVPVDSRIGPGHRIKSVVLSDGINTVNDITKSYEYVDPDFSTKSSGVLVQEAKNNFRATYGLDYVIYRNSATIAPLGFTRGEYLGYSTIKEVIKSNGTEFEKEYIYTTARNFPDIHNDELSFNLSDDPEDMRIFQPTSHDYGRGVLLSETVFDNTGKKIRKKVLDTDHIAHGNTTPGLNRLSPRIETQKMGEIYIAEFGASYDIRPTSMQYELPVWSKLVSEKNYIYEGLTGKEVTSEVDYLYNSTNHLQQRVTSTNSDGDQKVLDYAYAFEEYS